MQTFQNQKYIVEVLAVTIFGILDDSNDTGGLYSANFLFP